MKRTQQRYCAGLGLHTVPELRGLGDSEVLPCHLVRETSEAHHHLGSGQQCKLLFKKRSTCVTLGRERLVARRRTSHCRRHECIGQLKAVVARDRFGLVRQSRSKHRPIEPVPRAITGEYTARAIGTVGRWRKTENDDPRVRVAEATDGPTPVQVIPIRRSFGDRNLFPPGHQAGARPARLDLGAEFAKRVHG